MESKSGRQVARPLLKRFHHQKNRGTEGFGFIAINDEGYISDVFRSEKQDPALAAVRHCDASAILFHHRMPTSTPNYAGATHPIVVKNDKFLYDYYVVHNGVLQNEDALFEAFKKEGFQFTTEIEEVKTHRFVNTGESYEFDKTVQFNDSEVFAIDLARVLEGEQQYLRSSGTISFIALQCEKDGKVKSLVWGHNAGNPLVKEDDNSILVLKSLGDGKTVPIDTLFVKDWATKEVSERKLDIGFFHGRGRSFMGYRDRDDDDGHWDGKNAKGSRLPAKTESDLDKTLAKMLPASKIPFDDDDPRWEEHHASPDMRQMVADFNRHVAEDEEEQMQLEFDQVELAKEIATAQAVYPDSAEVIKALCDDLGECALKEEDALLELTTARELMHSAARRNIMSEMEEARSLLDAAEYNLKQIRTVRQATEAELSAYLKF